jgi:hypothetical protein
LQDDKWETHTAVLKICGTLAVLEFVLFLVYHIVDNIGNVDFSLAIATYFGFVSIRDKFVYLAKSSTDEPQPDDCGILG